VGLSHRNQTIQAFPPERPQEPLTEGIGLGTSHRSFEHLQPQMEYTLVEFSGEDRIAVMYQEAGSCGQLGSRHATAAASSGLLGARSR
jgi:hypothetical protein